MAMNLSPVLRQRFFDANGNPLAGGKLYTYQAGTSTPIATYTDSSGGTPNTNPVILDANGEANVWLNPSLAYKFVLKNSSDATQWTQDGVSGAGSVALLAVQTANIADDAVTADKLKDDALVDANRAVTTNHIRDSAVITGKINNNAVTTAKLSDGAVTQAKLATRATGTEVAAGGVAMSAGSATGGGTTATGLDQPIANCQVTITTTGRPVFIGVVSDGSGNPSIFGIVKGAAAATVIFKLFRGTTEIATVPISSQALGSAQVGVTVPPGVVWHIDPVTAGTYSYSLMFNSLSGSYIYNSYSKLVAYEI